MQRRGKHTSVTIDKFLGNGVFYVVPAEDSLKQRLMVLRRIQIVSGDGSRKLDKRWQENDQAVRRRPICCSYSEIVINPLPEYDQ
jgi:hypothetical protein